MNAWTALVVKTLVYTQPWDNVTHIIPPGTVGRYVPEIAAMELASGDFVAVLPEEVMIQCNKPAD